MKRFKVFSAVVAEVEVGEEGQARVGRVAFRR